MKRFAIAGFALATLASSMSAQAADMRMPLKAPPPAVAVYNWTGFYIGGNAGYSWGRASTDQTDTTTATTTRQLFRGSPPVGAPLGSGADLGFPALGLFPQVTTATATTGTSGRANVDGFVGGGQIGYNWQIDRTWLVGIEADFQGSTERGSVNVCGVATCAAGSAFGSASHDLRWFGTVRGRVGILPVDRVLLYATGGFAYGQLDSTYVTGLNGSPLAAFSSSSTRAGWTAGAGVEGAIDRNWTVKVEYLYMDLGRFAGGTGAGATTTTVVDTPILNNTATFRDTTVATTTGAASTRFTDHILRAGVNYRF